jgi:hypothetical protein
MISNFPLNLSDVSVCVFQSGNVTIDLLRLLSLKMLSQGGATVELSQALRERLKERHDSIGLFSRRRCSGMGVSPLARSATRTSHVACGSSTAGSSAQTTVATSTTNSATSPMALPVSPTFSTSTVPVVVTASYTKVLAFDEPINEILS